MAKAITRAKRQDVAAATTPCNPRAAVETLKQRPALQPGRVFKAFLAASMALSVGQPGAAKSNPDFIRLGQSNGFWFSAFTQ